MPLTRKCKNWLLSFRDWSLPRSEAPESFHFWSGLFTLSSALKRNIFVGREYLGGWECFPHLYVIFVAPPGKSRKSTTAAYSEELLREIPIVNRAPTSITKEQLLKKLSEAKDNSVSIFSSEFAMFIQKSGLDMYDVLTDLFDGKKDISVETIGRPKDFANKPCVNLLAATTPEWISSNMPESIIGGGFASRVIFVFEERVRRYRLYYKGIDYSYLDGLKKDLLADLLHIAVNIQGEFEIDEDGKHFMEQWYAAFMKEQESTSTLNYRLQGYYQRKPAYVHKLAMLLHVAQRDDLTLTTEDFEGAIKILNGVEKKMPKTFQNIGKNPYTVDMDRILAFIYEKGEVKRKELLAAFYHVAQPQILMDLVGALLAMGKIKVKSMNDGEPVYVPSAKS